MRPCSAAQATGFYPMRCGTTVIITLTAYFARAQTVDLHITPGDSLRVTALCVLEVTVLRFVLTIVRFTALFGYKNGKTSWGSISRYKQNEDEKLL